MPAGNTIYTSAASFEDLNLSPELLQVQISAWPFVSCRCIWLHDTRLELQAMAKPWCNGMQGLYTEMKFEKPSRIQAKTLPMILQPPYRSLIAQAR